MKATIFRVSAACSVLLVSLLTLAVLTEVALQLRSKFATVRSPTFADASSFKVLMVGDSVLGFLDRDPKGLAGRVKQAAPIGTTILEISEPALLTKPLADRAESLAKSIRPDLVVLMVGKSDYDAALTESPDGFDGLHVVRLARFVWGDLNLRYKRMTAVEELRLSRKHRLDAAWAAYGKLDCKTAIPIFSELLTERHDSPTDAPNARAIYDCYLKQKSYDEGAKFFADLAASARDGSTFRLYAGSLKVQGSGADPKLRKAAHLEIEHSMEHGDPRSIFKTKLWLAKTDENAEAFAKTLREMRPSENTVIDARTIENIRRTVSSFTGQGARVLILQYPTDHVEVWESNFKEFGEKVSFIEIRKWLLSLSDKELSAAVDEDIEHLTNEGADKLAPRLLNEIETIRKNRDQKRK